MLDTPKKRQEAIEKLLFRGLRKGEAVVDNRNKTIAKELGLGYYLVDTAIDRILAKKEKELNDRINKL